ncbi:zinc ribbon domain-containing protein [Streptomyces sp. NPDC004787]|uniref:zinc ribbon domain-containing protein n=1 Tax=Streptomyces sp. NPDC004787 TaxID=3154291 RepID=UPI0033AC1B2B
MFHTGSTGPRTSSAALLTDEPAVEPELHYQVCRWCRTTTFQRLLCPTCGSTDLTPELSAGEGVISVRRAFTAAEADLWPVHMAEGFVVRCRVDGPPHAVRPGVRVRLAGGGVGGGRRPVVRLCEEVALDGWF